MIFNRHRSVVGARVEPQSASIQQIRTAGVTSRSANTQGLPKIVSNVSVSISRTGTNRTLRISFTQNPADPYFKTAQAYIKQGNGTPTLLASGTSPIVITLPSSNAPAIVTVVSAGNWGTTSLAASPGKAVSLA